MKPFREPLIKCPKCGYYYLPAEIYYPDKLLGKPYDIEHTSYGEVLGYSGKNMDLTEYFECEKCGATFKSIGLIKFVTYPQEDLDFSEEEYTTQIAPSKLFLKED